MSMVRRYLDKKIFVLYFMQFILCFICFSFRNIRIDTILASIQIVMTFIIVNIVCGELFNYGTLFIVLTYVFHMGNLAVTQLFGYENNYLYSLSKDVICTSIAFYMLCHLAVLIGMCSSVSKEYINRSKDKFIINRNGLLLTGMVCAILGAFPKLYVDYQRILAQQSTDYSTSVTISGQYGWMSIVAQFFYVGVLILIFLSKEHKIRARIILVLASICEVVSMMSGGRLNQVSFLLIMVCVYVMRVERPKMSQVIVLFILAYFLCVLLNTIADLREIGTIGLEDFRNAIVNSLDVKNHIFDLLSEAGGTFMSLGLAKENFPLYHGFVFGRSYIDSILSVIPAYERNIADINSLIFIYSFPTNNWLGGSWLGEVYFNFSWTGCIFCYFIGRMLGKVENIFANDDKKNNFIGSLSVLAFMYPGIVWIRDYFYKFTTYIQVCAVVLVIAYILSRISTNKCYKFIN